MKKTSQRNVLLAIILGGLAGVAFPSWSATEINPYDKIYSDCIAASGPINNGVVYSCSSTADAAAKKKMTELYRFIHKNLRASDNTDADDFEYSQQMWLRYRDSHCKLAAVYIGMPMETYCPMELDISRVAELEEMAQNWK